MATYTELLNSDRMGYPSYDKRHIAMVAGRNAYLRRLAVEEVISRWGAEGQVRYYSASQDTPDTVLFELASRLAGVFYSVVVFEECEKIPDLEARFDSYIQRPTQGRKIIFVSSEKTDKTGQRWIRSTEESRKKVLYVDCGILAEENLKALARARNLSDEEADWLVAATAGDESEICRITDLLSVFEEPPNVRILFPEHRRAILRLTQRLSVFDSGSDMQLYTSLRDRFLQLAVVASVLQKNKYLEAQQIIDLERRIDVERFIVLRLLKVAREATPIQWLERAAKLAEVGRYVNEPGFREYIAGVLR